MSDDEDDYLSDKFLFSTEEPSTHKRPSTYSDLRREAAKKAQDRSIANRVKSARELREEALSKTLFERAQEEAEARRKAEAADADAAGSSNAGGNKALAMMMKMGFKPGMALGKGNDEEASDEKNDERDEGRLELDSRSPEPGPSKPTKGLVEPIAVKEWKGKQGIGVGSKRKAELEVVERASKSARIEDERDFRGRTATEFATRRAEGRIRPAQRTCMQLDEEEGVKFNVLWLDAGTMDVFPPGLYDALLEYLPLDKALSREERLRRQMQADALQPLDDAGEKRSTKEEAPSEEDIRVAAEFLALDPIERLERILEYLRERYLYCFWCGTRYSSADEMAQDCPGEDEELHD
ncbi:unnamed protein product [Peniophora sp. CBMAI 1063]|nr:unnamed protein product [Peniophora sp. CBMAI 1063]